MEVVVDHGQLLLALTPPEWQETFRSGRLLGRAISDTFRRSSTEALAYAARYPELAVYVEDMGRFFFVLVVVQQDGYAQRVFLERLTCATCSWSGMSANPLCIDQYIGLPAEVRTDLMRNALALPQTPCPQCNTALPRQSIWTEHQGA
ncbi:hypothetical protein Q5H92_10730 [Hymenobacter sp. M29]|uniref:Uncharacterized protein n=1 Tax=Hymenobacter mellowenesis TaxID=3063995 RepID=A0ABT9AAH2_9BACT|nr:hypothetical protein [Hymenobacter sp. M29]MDO7846833.1 hypothetical protein [Hymenobacter sp. M29]